MCSLGRWTSEESQNCNVYQMYLRILGFDYVFRRLKIGGDGLIPKYHAGSAQLAIFVKEDLLD